MFLQKKLLQYLEEYVIVNLIKLLSETFRLISSLINLLVVLLKNKRK